MVILIVLVQQMNQEYVDQNIMNQHRIISIAIQWTTHAVRIYILFKIQYVWTNLKIYSGIYRIAYIVHGTVQMIIIQIVHI